MDHFPLPLVLPSFKEVGSYFPHSLLESTDL